MKDDPIVKEYIIEDRLEKNFFNDHEWFWGLLFNLKREWAENYYNSCLARKNRIPSKLPEERVLKLSPEWIERLSKYEFKSSCKSEDIIYNSF